MVLLVNLKIPTRVVSYHRRYVRDQCVWVGVQIGIVKYLIGGFGCRAGHARHREDRHTPLTLSRYILCSVNASIIVNWPELALNPGAPTECRISPAMDGYGLSPRGAANVAAIWPKISNAATEREKKNNPVIDLGTSENCLMRAEIAEVYKNAIQSNLSDRVRSLGFSSDLSFEC